MRTKLLLLLIAAATSKFCIAQASADNTEAKVQSPADYTEAKVQSSADNAGAKIQTTSDECETTILYDDREEEKQTLLKFDIEARIDYQFTQYGGTTSDSESGFKGKYLVIRADGEIVKGLTYSWRQRLNTLHDDANFFNATDWVYLNYRYRNWNFQAGKQVVNIGGYEYDRAPIDLYACSVFWNNIPCYDLGVSIGYNVTPADRLTAQVTQSPFFTKENRNMYAYSLMWNGHHGFYESIYSANLLEYAKGKYINYIALGNKFTYRNVWLELDLMNRAGTDQRFLFKDWSLMTELSWSPNTRWRIFGKITYDVNHSGTDADLTVLDGTELSMAGGGVEFFPLRKKRHTLRLHADCFYSWGHNANESNLMQGKTLFISAGLTWDMNLLNIKINRKSKKPSNS